MNGLVNELLTLSKVDAIQREAQSEVTEPSMIIQHIINDMVVVNPEFKFKLHMDELRQVKLRIASHHLKQVMLIVLDNAMKYSHQTKVIVIEGKMASDTFAALRVIDYGMGIPKADLPHIFDRFYRVDKARSRKVGGSGLGLSIAKGIIEKYEGSLSIESEIDKGTTVTFMLPLASKSY